VKAGSLWEVGTTFDWPFKAHFLLYRTTNINIKNLRIFIIQCVLFETGAWLLRLLIEIDKK